MKAPSLELVEDIAGERLVLAAPPSGFLHATREMLVASMRSASRFVREIRARPRSPRELLVSFGMVLLVSLLGALVLLIVVMLALGAVMIVVLYVIGVWLVAWWLVPFAQRWVLGASSRRTAPARLTRLSIVRETATVEWRASVAGRCSFADLSGLRVTSRPQAAGDRDIVLELVGPLADGRLYLSLASVDREEEVVDLAMRMARVLDWHAFATTRDDLRGLEVELRPAPPKERLHPFRSYAAPPRFQEIGAPTETAIDWGAVAETGFREPIKPAPALDRLVLGDVGMDVPVWKPGTVVELRGERPIDVARRLAGVALATGIAIALPLSVVVMLNVAGGARLLETQQSGRLSPAGVLGLLTSASACVGWLLALIAAARRTGKNASIFDWATRTVTIRDDDGRRTLHFSDIVELLLTETTGGRHTLSIAFQNHPAQLLLEAGAGAAPAEACLGLTVELARALGVAWRCASDLP